MQDQGADGVTRERVSAGVVFGVSGGLLVLLICLATLVGFGPRSMSAGEALAENYELGALPFGFSLQPELFLLPAGEQVYVMNAEGFVPVKLERFSFEDEPPPGMGPGEPAGVDWSAVQVLSKNAPPQQLYLVEYPISRAESVIASQFRSLNWRQLSQIDRGGGRSAVDGGQLEWNGYTADYVRQREFRPGLRFMDQVRVNLTVGGKCWIAYALWPEQHEGSVEPVRQLLAALRPIE